MKSDIGHDYCLEEEHIQYNFPAGALVRGRDYYKKGHVSHFYHERISPTELKMVAFVSGSQRKPYKTEVIAYFSDDTDDPGDYWDDEDYEDEEVEFASTCSCPVAYKCKHVVATLYFALEHMDTSKSIKGKIVGRNTGINQLLEQELNVENPHKGWMAQFKHILEPSSYPSRAKIILTYMLSVMELDNRQTLFVKLKANVPGEGKKRAYVDFSINDSAQHRSISADEQSLLSKLRDAYYIANQSSRENNVLFSDSNFPLTNMGSGELLKSMLLTEQCYWLTTENKPLRLSNGRRGSWQWSSYPDGSQKLNFNTKHETIILPTQPPFYFDEEKNTIGLVQTGLSGEKALALLQLPRVPHYGITEVEQLLIQLVGKNKAIPKANKFKRAHITNELPQPRLYLFGDQKQREDCVGFAKLDFKYQHAIAKLSDPGKEVAYVKDDVLHVYERDLDKEKSKIDDLVAFGASPVAWMHNVEQVISQQANQEQLDFVISLDQEKIMDFNMSTLPALREKGWDIVVDPSFPVYCIDEPEEWYTKVEDDESEYDWFKLEVGITVDNKQINILPLLSQAIQNQSNDMSAEYIESLADDYKHLIQIDDGKYLSVPNHRLKGFLSILSELYNTESNGEYKFSKHDATQLYQLEMLLGATNLRWLGGEKLRRLGQKLSDFTGIESIHPPKGLKAELRAYQQEGFNWLNFLREYELGGILADDMGLGKTMQVLTLLQNEKEQGRLTKPCLIVAPTSLMVNWVNEIEKFTPDLSVVMLQGPDRHDKFSLIESCDVALTTYPLLVRDEEYLLDHEFYYLILDEAQNIKNFLSKSVGCLHKLRSEHRLCLSGTPVENHLGELWSLFHFVLPGLLSDYKTFNKVFKTPIEKRKDFLRQSCLANRVAPFMLRRTKEKVVKELPGKTVRIEVIELKKKQRDLYESIRLTMEHKISQAIQQKGLKRSHIIILDALLKLRQACNDPRLLKLTAAKKIKESAKLEHLKKLVKKLIKSGKKILIFSSFTTMLSLIEDELLKQKISYSKLTGQTLDRASEVNNFQAGKTNVFLISLKAGGVGLNLTAADTVIHYDPWWNPAAEEQATDRAYRIGQDKPVMVYKLVTKGSLEETILEMQNNKRSLLNGLFDASAAKSGSRLTEHDLSCLFQPLADLGRNDE